MLRVFYNFKPLNFTVILKMPAISINCSDYIIKLMHLVKYA